MSVLERYKFWMETGEFSRIESLINAYEITDPFLYKFNLLCRKVCK